MNELEKYLSDSLKSAEERKAKGLSPMVCVVEGPTGSGKTPIINNFLKGCGYSSCDFMKFLINTLTYLDVDVVESLAEPEAYGLEQLSYSTNENGENTVKLPFLFSSKEVDLLEKTDIVFIDDYDWKKLCVRQQLMQLIKSSQVVDLREENNGYLKRIDNTLMFIVVIHPKYHRLGQEPLTEKELEFLKSVK